MKDSIPRDEPLSELITAIDSFFHDSHFFSGFILQQTNSNLWKIMIYRQTTILPPK